MVLFLTLYDNDAEAPESRCSTNETEICKKKTKNQYV